MSRTILAPLTTTFTPPLACSTYANSGNLDTTMTYWQAQTCSKGNPHDYAGCWPPALVATPKVNLLGFGMYSPGLHCPVGYASACTGAMDAKGSPNPLQIGTSFEFQFPLTAGETAIGCCPLGLTCERGTGVQTCMATITTGQVPNIVGFCPNDSTAYYAGTTVNINSGYVPGPGNSTLVTISTATLYGPLIQIVFKSTDISSLPTPSSASLTSTPSAAIAASATYSNSADSTNNSTTSDSGGGGLSTGAKIGIGLGVPLAVLLVAGLAAAILFRRRRARRTGGDPVPSGATQNPIEKPSGGDNLHANYPQQGYGYYNPTVMKPTSFAEAPDTQRNAELDAAHGQRPIELSAYHDR